MPPKLPRLFVDAPLRAGAEIALAPAQAHYLINVLRCKSSESVLVFNGKDGEWRARLEVSRKTAALCIEQLIRPQQAGPDLHYLFAPLKRARLDYMAQKATELGVSRLIPVLTRRTVPERVNRERLLANAVEAAEQCGILHVPEVSAPQKLGDVLTDWDMKRALIYADEQAPQASPLAALAPLTPGPLAVLIGPEGGFEQEEREQLRRLPFVLPISLGPRVMRADTAAVAALSLINATLGDWR